MQIRTVTASEAATHMLKLAANGPSVVFVGAFVSSRGPSSLPMSAALKRAIALRMWHAATPVLSSTIGKNLIKRLDRSRFSDVPLELLAEEVIKKTGLTVKELFGWLGEAQPNTNHRVLAALSDRKVMSVATTNFDELIERSATRPRRIVKLHGTVSHQDSMVVTLSQVGRGLVSHRSRHMLRRTLRGKSVCFIGYAGRDPDIFPVLGELGLRDVLWIARPAASVADEESIAAELAHCGRLEARVESLDCVSVDGNAVFDALGRTLGLRAAGTPGPRALDWRSAIKEACRPPSADVAAVAFARILGAVGLWGDATRAYARIAAGTRRSDVRRDARLYDAEAHYWLGEYDIAKDRAKYAARAYRLQGDRLGEARADQILGLIAGRTAIGRARSWSPRYMDRISHLLAGERSTDGLLISTNNYLNLGVWLKNTGDLEKAESALSKGLQQARQLGDMRSREKFHHAFGILLRRRRQVLLSSADSQAAIARAARRHLKRAEELARYLGATSEEVRVRSTQIELELDGIEYVRGAKQRASRLIRDQEVLVANSWEPEQRGVLLKQKAFLLMAGKHYVKAVAAFTAALESVRTSTVRASCFEGRAKAQRAIGNHTKAVEDIGMAMRMTPPGLERQRVAMLARAVSLAG